MEQTVLISRRDYDRLWGFLTAIRDRRPEQGSLLDRLERVLATAKTLPTGAVPPGRITLNSYVTLRERETGIVLRFQLVFPWDSNVEKQRLSVLSSIGTDILGRTVGKKRGAATANTSSISGLKRSTERERLLVPTPREMACPLLIKKINTES